MFSKIALPLFMSFLSLTALPAQEIWTLPQCIEYANDHSIAIKQAELGIKSALVTQKSLQYSRIPNLSASISGGLQFGRTIDPTTNSFDNQTIGFNSMQLSTGVAVFNGNRINNSVKQAKIDTEVARLDAETAADNLFLGIASAYLSILMAEEQLANAQNRLRLSRQQLDQIDKLIRAGVRPDNDRLNILAQMALDEQTIITVQNSVDQGYLQLKNLLLLDPAKEIKIAKPSVSVPEITDQTSLSFEAVYAHALQNQPSVVAAGMRQTSADKAVSIAKAGYYPTLSLFASMDTRWSSVGKMFLGSTTSRVPITAYIDNTPITVEFEEDIPEFADAKYWDQVNENFGQSIGASLSIPIYDNSRTRLNVERAQLGVLGAQYAAEQTRQQLKNDVQAAVANARASRQSYDAALKALEASKVAFENAEKRFNLGNLNSFELQTARTNLDNAETEVTRSKYDFLFRLKIVDFYLGRELKLD